MEQSLGASFADVSIFEGHTAVAMGAEAFTHGEEVHFAPGRYDPGSAPGRELIGHELTHVIQQRAGRVADGQGKDADVVVDAGLEAEADAAGARAAVGERVHVPGADASVAPPGAVQRKVTVNPVAATHHTAAQIQSMTVDELLAYTNRQADWSTQLSDPDKTELQNFHVRLRQNPHIATGAGPMTVHDVRACPDQATFEKYCHACHDAASVPTSRIDPVNTVAEALQLGHALTRLDNAVGGARLNVIGNDKWIKELVSQHRVDDFAQYVEQCDPILQARATEEQGEIASFLKHPPFLWMVYKATVLHVRNYHRFEAVALLTLAGNWTDTSKARPLTLILHTPLDHNAAFHHDPALTATITNANNLTLMIEGATSLAGASSLLQPIAHQYGQHGRIDQVMLAGHGESRALDIAGDATMGTDAQGNPEVQEHFDDVDLDGNRPATEAFFRELLNNMDPAGRRRILLNGCLTASNDVWVNDSAATPAEQQIQNQLNSSPNLVRWLGDFATHEGFAGMNVMGANASFGRGVEFIDAATGDLSMSDPGYDPALTADKVTYIRQGHEPLGVIRALVEEWENPAGAASTPAWLTAVDARLASPQNDWDNVVIQTAFTIIKASYQSSPGAIRRLGNDCGNLSEAYFSNEARVPLLSGLLPAHRGAFFAALQASGDWPAEEDFGGLVILQIWQSFDASKQSDLLALLGTKTTGAVSEVMSYGRLGNAAVGAMAPVADASSPSDGQLVLTLGCVNSSTPNQSAKQFLRAAASGNSFPVALSTRIRAKLTDGSETEILQRIGLADVSNSGGQVDANVDADGDGTNETFVDATARNGTIANCSLLNVRRSPRMGNNILGTMHRGDAVHVYGMSRNWCAVQFAGTTGYIYKRFVAFA